jgi:hypothetical protein
MERNGTNAGNEAVKLVLAIFVVFSFAACGSSSKLSKDGGAGAGGAGHDGSAGASDGSAGGAAGGASGGSAAGQTGIDAPIESSADAPIDAPVEHMASNNMCEADVPLPDGGVGNDPLELAPGFTCAPIFMLQQAAMPSGVLGLGQGACGGYLVWVAKEATGTLVCIYDTTAMTVPPQKLVGAILVDSQHTLCVGAAPNLPMTCADPVTYAPPPKPDAGYPDDLAPMDAPPNPTLETSLKNGIVAQWPLDGDGTDHSGHGLDLTIDGLSFAPSRFGSGLTFPGDLTKTAKRPMADPSLLIEGNDYTVSLWVNLAPDQHASQGILDYGAQVGAWGFGTPGGAQPGGGQSQIWFWSTDVGGIVGPDPDPGPGSGWHHIIAERAGSTINLYSASALVMTTNANGQPSGMLQTFQLGTWAGGHALPLFGVIDDVAIWNRALTADERFYLDQHQVPRVVP